MTLSKTRLLDERALTQNIRKSHSANTTANTTVSALKAALSSGRELLKAAHDAGTPAPEIVQNHAWLVDRLLHHLWVELNNYHQPATELSLVAVGGYGRGELHPHSDVDVLLLIRNEANNRVLALTERLVQTLWDIGLDVGYSTRTVAQCVEEATKDVTVITNLMESRCIAGSIELWRSMVRATEPKKIWPVDKFFEAKINEQQARHLRYGETAYSLEPNVKEGKGGLRDLQIILWVAQRHFGATSSRNLVDQGFLSEDEHRVLIRSRNLLWRVRNALHFAAGRREDRLLFDHQRSLAAEFGFENTENRLAVEQFMKRYYRTVKDIRLLSDILLQHFEEVIVSPQASTQKYTELNERFVEIDGYLSVKNQDTFKQHPPALLELFLLFEQHDHIKNIRAQTIRLLRENLALINADFRREPRCRELFIKLFKQPNGVTRALRRMNAYGVLGAYIPAFGRIVGQMQHDLFHVFTVDAHSLFVLRNLRRFMLARFSHELPQANAVMSRVTKRERLLLASLFHDIAKGRGGDHSILGEQDAQRFCRAHGFSDYDSEFIAWLVRHHLTMSWTAQRKDISDPDIVTEFAEIVGNQEHLDNLYLLTMADIRGTNLELWNSWKGKLLEDLYLATSRVLRQSSADYGDHQKRLKRLKSDALEQCQYAGLDETKVLRFWENLEDGYFQRHEAGTITWHTQVILSASILDVPIVAIRHEAELAANQILVLAPEQVDLLSRVTDGLAISNLSIQDARLHTTLNGFSLQAFVALTARGKAATNSIELKQLEQRLKQRVLNPSIDSLGVDHVSRQHRQFPIKTSVTFSATRKGDYTVMEVVAHDRPGLVNKVARSLVESKIHLRSAKISTVGEKVEDIFFIVDRDGVAITKQPQLDGLADRIHALLDEEPAAAHAIAI